MYPSQQEIQRCQRSGVVMTTHRIRTGIAKSNQAQHEACDIVEQVWDGTLDKQIKAVWNGQKKGDISKGNVVEAFGHMDTLEGDWVEVPHLLKKLTSDDSVKPGTSPSVGVCSIMPLIGGAHVAEGVVGAASEVVVGMGEDQTRRQEWLGTAVASRMKWGETKWSDRHSEQASDVTAWLDSEIGAIEPAFKKMHIIIPIDVSAGIESR